MNNLLTFGKYFTLIFFAFFVAVACEGEQKKDFAIVKGIQDIDTLENEFAKAFQIIQHRAFIEINIIDPDTDVVLNSYKVSKTEESEADFFPKNMDRVVALSATQVGMLRKLSLGDKIAGVSKYDYLCNPVSKAVVTEVGDIGMSDAEAFVAVNPDIILYSGFNDDAPILNKLAQANLKTFKIFEWKETHPMGRAEWILVYGALFQKEKEAKAIFEEIKAKYYAITDKLKLADKGPSVFAGTYFGDAFNVPAGESFMAQFFKDANINYVYSRTKGTASLTLSLEDVITNNQETEFWLNAGASSKEELLKQSQKFGMLKAVKTGKLFSYFNNTNCFWENSPIEPHKVLEDLGKIFHPDLFEDKELTFYELLP
ncbi:ABC transporter substrate-binding protein [Brumimicrobium oceani]|nr:ABC transporter substrate-binding protein [Brumimicrobium oceani]